VCRARSTALALILAVFAAQAMAQVRGQNRFYHGGDEGWFWYEPEPVPIPEKAPQPETEATQALPAPSPAASPPAPAPLSAEWMRENLDRYRDLAIDDPTPQNVSIYLYLQRAAMDKSSRFAEVAQRVVQSDPLLDEITQRPTATFGANLANRQASATRDRLLQRIAGMAAIWFFFRSDCPYCDAQAPVLAMLQERYGFVVLAISLDGRALPNGLFPDFKVDRGQSRGLGIVSTPALFLARPPSPLPIAQGLLSLTQLQERILVAALQAGWVSEGELPNNRALLAAPNALTSPTIGDFPRDPDALLGQLRAMASGSNAP